MADVITSLIRTVVPILVGWVASALLLIGVDLDPETSAQLIAALTSILTAVYYGLVRLLEAKWPPAGWLLGRASPPSYTGKHLA